MLRLIASWDFLLELYKALLLLLRVMLGAVNCTNYTFVREEDKEKTHQQCFINAPEHSSLCGLSTKMEFEGISQHSCLQGENKVERTSASIRGSWLCMQLYQKTAPARQHPGRSYCKNLRCLWEHLWDSHHQQDESGPKTRRTRPAPCLSTSCGGAIAVVSPSCDSENNDTNERTSNSDDWTSYKKMNGSPCCIPL